MTKSELIKIVVEIQASNLKYAIELPAHESRSKIVNEVNARLPIGITPFTEETLLLFVNKYGIMSPFTTFNTTVYGYIDDN